MSSHLSLIQPDREPTHKNTSTSGGCNSLVLFIISPGGNPPPPHWSRVLHHNGGPNQYKSCVFVFRVRRVRPRDLSELGRRSVGRKSPRAPQCSNLEGFAGTRDPTEPPHQAASPRPTSLINAVSSRKVTKWQPFATWRPLSTGNTYRRHRSCDVSSEQMQSWQNSPARPAGQATM